MSASSDNTNNNSSFLLPITTNANYQNAFALNENETAYLQALTQSIKYENGVFSIEGLPFSEVNLKNYYKNKKDVKDLDVSIIALCYGIILENYKKKGINEESFDDIIEISKKDLMKKAGYYENYSPNSYNSIVQGIINLTSIMGVREKGKHAPIPLLVYLGPTKDEKGIRFIAPYLNIIIYNIYKDNLRKIKGTTKLLLKRDGTPQVINTGTYAYLIDNSILKEKNKKAVEIVFAVVSRIITQKSPIEFTYMDLIQDNNCPCTYNSLNMQTSKASNVMLKRIFPKAWELLTNKTILTKKYKNITLPDITTPAPTIKSLNTKIIITHQGKNNDEPN